MFHIPPLLVPRLELSIIKLLSRSVKLNGVFGRHKINMSFFGFMLKDFNCYYMLHFCVQHEVVPFFSVPMILLLMYRLHVLFLFLHVDLTWFSTLIYFKHAALINVSD